MRDTNTAAATALALGLVVSSCILYFALGSLGKSIERAATYVRPQPVHVPDRIEISTRNLTPQIIRLENSPSGGSLKIDTSNTDR